MSDEEDMQGGGDTQRIRDLIEESIRYDEIMKRIWKNIEDSLLKLNEENKKATPNKIELNFILGKILNGLEIWYLGWGNGALPVDEDKFFDTALEKLKNNGKLELSDLGFSEFLPLQPR